MNVHKRWAILALLFLATVINYLDRQVLSITVPVLREELGMDASAYSRVVTAFLVAYTIMQTVGGRLVDIVGARRGLLLAMLWWSTAGMLHAAARSTFQMGLFRFLLGAGEAANWPAAVKAVREWFPAPQRAFAVGIFNSGSAIGALIAPPLIAALTLSYSWRIAFLVTGALGFVWVAAWLLVYKESAPEEAGPLRADAGDGITSLLRTRSAWGLMLARFFADPVWWFYVFWLPDYLNRERGFSLQMIGYTAWAPFLAADAGNIAGGWLSGKFVQRGVRAPVARKIAMAIGALGMCSGAFVVSAPQPVTALALICVATFSYSCWAANVLTLPTDVFAARSVGAAVGLSGTAAGVGGILTTLGIGSIVDRFSYAPVFAGAALLPVFALAAVLLLVSASEAAA